MLALRDPVDLMDIITWIGFVVEDLTATIMHKFVSRKTFLFLVFYSNV